MIAIAAASALPAAAEAPVKICTTVWPPYTIVNEAGSVIGGIHTDLVQEAFKRGGLGADIREMPWKRCLTSLEEGSVDAVYSASKKADRELFLHYPAVPIQTVAYVFMALKDTSAAWDKGRNLKALPTPVGAPLGYSTTDELIKAGVQVEETNSDLQNVRKLVLGRVPVILIEEQVGMSLLERVGALAHTQVLNPPYVEGKAYYLAVAKKGPRAAALLALVEKSMAELESEKFLLDLIRRY